jgi:hypothetical protein
LQGPVSSSTPSHPSTLPGRGHVIVILNRARSRFCAPAQALTWHLLRSQRSPPCGWSFLKTTINGPVTAHRLAAYPNNDHYVPCRGLLNMISLRTWTPHGPNTLCDWGSRAERLDRSLDAYTPIPSTPSSMGALVTVPQSCRQDWYVGLEWLPIFGRGFGLRCFQPLSSIAWLPGSALSDNR